MKFYEIENKKDLDITSTLDKVKQINSRKYRIKKAFILLEISSVYNIKNYNLLTRLYNYSLLKKYKHSIKLDNSPLHEMLENKNDPLTISGVLNFDSPLSMIKEDKALRKYFKFLYDEFIDKPKKWGGSFFPITTPYFFSKNSYNMLL